MVIAGGWDRIFYELPGLLCLGSVSAIWMTVHDYDMTCVGGQVQVAAVLCACYDFMSVTGVLDMMRQSDERPNRKGQPPDSTIYY